MSFTFSPLRRGRGLSPINFENTDTPPMTATDPTSTQMFSRMSLAEIADMLETEVMSYTTLYDLCKYLLDIMYRPPYQN